MPDRTWIIVFFPTHLIFLPLKQWEENLRNGKQTKNPQISIGSLHVTGALRLRIELCIGTVYYPFS